MGAVATGRLGTAMAFVLLPLIGMAVGRILTGPPRRARRAAWATGLLVGVAAAFVPLIWPIAVIGAIGLVAAWPWLGRATAVNAAIAAVVPAAVLVPWTFHLFTSDSAFFLEAGIQRPGLALAGLRPESVLLLSPGGPGLPPAWVTVGLSLPAFGALLARRRLPLVYTGWAIALGGLVAALVVSRVRVMAPDGTAVSAWPGVAIAVAAVGLLLAAAPLIEAAALALGRIAAARDGRRFPAGWRGLAVLAGVAVAASAPVLAAGYWLAAGVRGPVAAAGPQILPPFVASSSSAGDRTRTLVLRPDGAALSYAVLRSTDPVLGEPELTEASSATHALDGIVASLGPEMGTAAGGDGGDTGQALSQFDIGYVLLPAPVDQSLAHQLDGSAGLMPLTTASAYDLWQVAGTVARARVIGADGAVPPVPSGPDRREHRGAARAPRARWCWPKRRAGGPRPSTGGRWRAWPSRWTDGRRASCCPPAAATSSSPVMSWPGTSASAPRPPPSWSSSRSPCRGPGRRSPSRPRRRNRAPGPPRCPVDGGTGTTGRSRPGGSGGRGSPSPWAAPAAPPTLTVVPRLRPARPGPLRPWPLRPWPLRPWPLRPWPLRPWPLRPWRTETGATETGATEAAYWSELTDPGVTTGPGVATDPGVDDRTGPGGCGRGLDRAARRRPS